MKPSKTLLAVLLLLIGCARTAAQDTLEFTVSLDGTEALPPNASFLTGEGSFTLNPGSLFQGGLFVERDSGQGNVTFYTSRSATALGTPVFSMTPGEWVPPIEPIDHGGRDFFAGRTLSETECADLLAGHWWAVYITPSFPDGEIRGQVVAAPVITTQPASTNVIAGNPATITVSATGVPTPTYQWRKNGTDIDGATNTSYTISNVQPSDAGNYTVLVTNLAGSVTSAVASLGVNNGAALELTVSLDGRTALPPNASFLHGDGSFTLDPGGLFQGSIFVGDTEGAVSIFGSSSPDLLGTSLFTLERGPFIPPGPGIPGGHDFFAGRTLPETERADLLAGNWWAVYITPSFPDGELRGQIVAAPVITAQPASTNVIAGNTATFTVSAIGVPTPTYQWRKNGTDIDGATNSSYTISNVQPSSGGDYNVLVTNLAGSVTSAVAMLGVNNGATLELTVSLDGNHAVPPNASFLRGDGSFTLDTGGLFQGSIFVGDTEGAVSIFGSSSPDLLGTSLFTLERGPFIPPGPGIPGGHDFFAGRTLPETERADLLAGNWWAVYITPSFPDGELRGQIVAAPVITAQPASTNVIAGNTATFTVSAIGVPTPTYQWRKNGTDIDGATNSSYTISNVQPSSGGDYNVLVTNLAGSVTSAVAMLGVNNGATLELTVSLDGNHAVP